MSCWILLACLTGYGAAFVQPPAPEVTRAPVTWLIFADDLHLDFRNTGRIRDVLKRIAAELVLDGDNFAIVSSGPSALAIDITADRQVLDGAIKRTIGNALKFEDLQAGDGSEALYRASIALATAQSVLDNVPRAPSGPKALLYISNGYNLDALPSRTRIGNRNATRSGVLEQLADLSASAAALAIPIFAIDPRAAIGNADPYPANPAWQDHLAASRNFLQTLSGGSGGFEFVEGDFAAYLKRIAEMMGR